MVHIDLQRFSRLCLALSTIYITIGSTIVLTDFQLCKQRHSGTNIIKTLFFEHRMRCAFTCSRDTSCRAATVFRRFPDLFECILHDGFYSLGCYSFPLLDTVDVYLIIKKDGASMPFMDGCFNGGTLSAGSCLCKEGYAGNTCQRYIYDCQEGFAQLTAPRFIEPVIIQPKNYNTAYEVMCNYVQGKTIFITRKPLPGTPTFSRNMAEYKYPFGIQLDYWIGLEAMHAVMNQPGRFDLQVYCETRNTGFSHFYTDAKMDDESSGYSLQAIPFNNNDGLHANLGPLKFCIPGNCGGLNGNTDGGWWYSIANQNYAMTRSTSLPRSINNNQEFECTYISMQTSKK